MIGEERMIMDWLRKAPTSLVITVCVVIGVASVAYLGGYVYLTASGADTTDYRSLLNSTFNYLGILFGATTTVASVAAAKSSSKTEENSNGALSALQAENAELRARLAGVPPKAPQG
jgi:cytochrome c biogenesis protein CcdA